MNYRVTYAKWGMECDCDLRRAPNEREQFCFVPPEWMRLDQGPYCYTQRNAFLSFIGCNIGLGRGAARSTDGRWNPRTIRAKLWSFCLGKYPTKGTP